MRADDASVQVFIHDRGPGFDPAAIPPYRHGINESIVARMRRNGGDAEINSRPVDFLPSLTEGDSRRSPAGVPVSRAVACYASA